MTRPDNAPSAAHAPDICILLNPGSGKGGRERRIAIDQAIGRHPGRFEIRLLRKGRDFGTVCQSAVGDGFTTLVAAGGDGTIGAVADVAQKAGVVLGVLPQGTFNFFARGLSLPETIDEAIDLIARGSTREVEVGEVNGKLFLNNASIGLYPAILAQREGIYKRWGRSRLAAHWSMLKTFMQFHRPARLHLTVDGEELDRTTPLVFVARSAYQLEFFDLEGVRDVSDGKFGLFVAPDRGRWSLFVFAVRLAWKSTERGRDFDYLTGREVDIRTARGKRLVARDGERDRMSSPLVFRIRETPLRVIAPEGP